MFGEDYDKTLLLATTTFALLDNLGLKVHPTKGHFFRCWSGIILV